MDEFYTIEDLRTLDRFAQKEGYNGLREYLPTIRAWNLSVETAAECIRRGISFSEYHMNPSLLEEELPENVVRISDLYHAQSQGIAEERRQKLEARILGVSKPRHFLTPVFYGIMSGLSAAALLVGLSSLPGTKYLGFSEGSLTDDPLCMQIESVYTCLDPDEQGQFFGSYWQNKNN